MLMPSCLGRHSTLPAKRAAQVQMRSVDAHSLLAADSAVELQLSSERRDGKVTGKSLNTVSGSTIRSGIYLQQQPDNRPTNRSACRIIGDTGKCLCHHFTTMKAQIRT